MKIQTDLQKEMSAAQCWVDLLTNTEVKKEFLKIKKMKSERSEIEKELIKSRLIEIRTLEKCIKKSDAFLD